MGILGPPASVDELRRIGVSGEEIYLVGTDEPWVHMHKTHGPHVLAWNQFRSYGPVKRFDQHPMLHDAPR